MTTTITSSVRWRLRETGVNVDDTGFSTRTSGDLLTNTFSNSVVRGDNLGRWRWLIANQENATTTLSGFRIYPQITKGHLFRLLKPKSLNPSGLSKRWSYMSEGDLIRFSPPGPPQTVILDEANRLAQTNFLKKCYEAQRALQSGVILGELGEALRMIKSPAKSLRYGLENYLAFLRKGRKAKGLWTQWRKEKFLAETWLEWSYGWLPLFSDVKAGYEAVTEYYHKQRPFEMVRAKGFNKSSTHSGDRSSTSNGGITWSWATRQDSEGHVKYYGMVRVLNEFGYVPDMRYTGFDPRSFVPTVWELIPYSFLVDYFTNIGDLLSAWSFNQSDLHWVSKGTLAVSTIYSVDERVDPSTDPTFVTVADIGHPGKLSWRREAITRGPYYGSLVPSFRFEIPGMSSLKWLNMAALGRLHFKMIPF